MDETPPLPLVVLHDGAAGNRRQALALADAWGLPFDECLLVPRWPWRWAAPRMLPGTDAAFGPAFAAMLARPPAVAVGCGRQAALATRLLHERGSRVVQVLHPRLPTHHWDALVLPAHDGVQGPNVLTLRGSLHAIDAHWLARTRAAHPSFGEGPGPRTAFLLGGPTEDSDWDAAALDSALALLLRWQARDGGRLWVIGSRRTPAAMRRQAKRAVQGQAQVWMDERDGPNPYDGALAWADRLVVTPDSANLISEAAATDALLWIAFPRYQRGRLRQLVDEAIAGGRARALGPEAAPWAVAPWREAARVAERLRPYVLEAMSSAAS